MLFGKKDVRMRKLFDVRIRGRRQRRRTCLRWLNQIQKIISSFDISNWRRCARLEESIEAGQNSTYKLVKPIQ